MNISLLLQMRVSLQKVAVPGSLACCLAILLAAPLQAAELSYSSTPLFWATGVQPNVALMIDTSGSMGATDTGGTGNITSVCNGATFAQPLTRMQAAKEAACQVSLENAAAMRIGLYRFNGTKGQRSLPIQANSATDLKTAITGFGAADNTPLSSTMKLMLDDYVGASSPIQYRCQKNYVVFFTDGAPNAGLDLSDDVVNGVTVYYPTLTYPTLFNTQKSTWHNSTAQSGAASAVPGWDGFLDPTYKPDGENVYPWLDELSQFAYDVDMKGATSTTPGAACPNGNAPTAGQDCAGKDWDGADDTDARFEQQNVVTYTLGLGAAANNGLLRNTPLVNRIALTPANVNTTDNTILITAHGLSDGQYVHYYRNYATTDYSTVATGNTGNDQMETADTSSMAEGSLLTYSNAGGATLEYGGVTATSCNDAGGTLGLISGSTYYVASRSATTMRLATSPILAATCAAAANGNGVVNSDCIDLTGVGAASTTQSFARAARAAASPSVSLSSTTTTAVFNGGANIEKIIISNHGLTTGDLVTYTCANSCNGTTTIGGLTSGNTYYIAMRDANTFRLASSLAAANACAGLADGNTLVATNCINITLPTSTTAKTHTFARAALTAQTATFTADGIAANTTPVNTATGRELITFTANHSLNTSDKVTYTCAGGLVGVPGSTRSVYYARNVSVGNPGSFQLSLTLGGAPIDISAAGNSSQTFTWTSPLGPGIGGLYGYETDAAPDNTPTPASEPAARGKYYVEYVSADSFKLRQCGATADCAAEAATTVDLTSAGYGTLSTGPGRSYFSSTTAELANSLSQAFKSISANTLSFSSVSNSSKTTGANQIYQAQFSTEDWSGEVMALATDSNGLATGSIDWFASQHVPLPPARTLLTWNPTTAVGVLFTTVANLTPTQQISLNTALTAADQQKVLDWVRGKDDATLAGSRTRSNGLYGDIINGTTQYVGVPNENWDNDLPAGTPGKSTYFAFKDGNTRTPMLYVGANDGMLHGINTDTGAELMGFIPDAVYVDFLDANDNGLRDTGETYVQKFYELSRKNYGQIGLYPHRFFVDGKTSSGDAYFVNAKAGLPPGSWHTVLLGGLGKGGRSIYALDVTDPSSFDTSKVLWEFGATNTGGKMGYTYSKPQVARLQSGQWVAIFGNGYDGSNDIGRLFVVDIETGVMISRLDAPTSKGLSNITLLKDGTGTVLTAYAGDLAGNLWKFDLSNANPNLWVAPTAPLFRAVDKNGNGQPITSSITLGTRPAGSPSCGGQCAMLYFGTGSYFVTADKSYDSASATPLYDSLYAIYDDDATAPISAGSLVEQTMSTTTVNGTVYRTISNNKVSYSSDKGWFINLVVGKNYQGERIVFDSALANGALYFNTVVPAGKDLCTSFGTSWVMTVDPLSGGMLPVLYDTNGDGISDIDTGDVQTAGVEGDRGIFTGPSVSVTTTTTTLPSGETETVTTVTVTMGASGGGANNSKPGIVQKVFTYKKKGGGVTSSKYPSGRMSWRQLQ